MAYSAIEVVMTTPFQTIEARRPHGVMTTGSWYLVSLRDGSDAASRWASSARLSKGRSHVS